MSPSPPTLILSTGEKKGSDPISAAAVEKGSDSIFATARCASAGVSTTTALVTRATGLTSMPDREEPETQREQRRGAFVRAPSRPRRSSATGPIFPLLCSLCSLCFPSSGSRSRGRGHARSAAAAEASAVSIANRAEGDAWKKGSDPISASALSITQSDGEAKQMGSDPNSASALSITRRSDGEAEQMGSEHDFASLDAPAEKMGSE